jgi:hypothetical protein
MSSRRITSLAALLVGMVIGTSVLQGQATTVPRTSDGRPDVQGVWDFSALTPLQRPREFATKPFLTEDEAAQFIKRTLGEQNTDRPLPNGPIDVRTLSQLAYNEFWWERPHSLAVVRGRILSSLIVDPPDGKLPALTPEAEQRRVAQQRVMTENIADDPEQRLLTERCLSTHAGPPMLPGNETSYLQLVQTRNYLVIAAEASNAARIVPLERRPRLPASIRGWQGDSHGRWENDTLVVDTTNIRPNSTLTIGADALSDATFHLIERFTIVDTNTLLYEFTVDAPRIFVRPWTATVPMKRTTSRIFEYACHEGNYGLQGILRGARAQGREK